MNLEPRDLLSFVQRMRTGPIEACWEWAGRKGRYGQWRRWYAHRLAFTIFVGPIPEGYEIDHLCENKTCINPHHLEAVPIEGRENTRRFQAKKTHCPRGHPYDETNTYRQLRNGRVSRSCKTCRKMHADASYRRRRAQA